MSKLFKTLAAAAIGLALSTTAPLAEELRMLTALGSQPLRHSQHGLRLYKIGRGNDGRQYLD